MSTQRRVSAAGVALMLGGAGILLAAAPAQAAEVSFKTECIPPAISGMPPVQGTTKVRITAPAEAKVGDEVEVVWKTVQAASKNPDVLDLEKDTVKPTGVIKVGGAASGTLTMEGPRQNPPIPKNSPMTLPDMKGRLKLEKAGEITLTPDKYNINVSKPMSTDTKCSPKETVAVGATIKVTEGGGGGGSSSGGSTTTGGGGGGDGQTDFPGKEVAVQFTCQSPGPANITSKVTINAKKNADSYDLTVKTAKGVMNSPAPLPAGALKPSMAVKLGGADSGTVKVEGPANAAPLEQGKPVDLPDMKGTYKPGATGRSTLSPGTLTITVNLGGSPIVIPCQVKGTVQASLELDTAQQPGGASGGGDTTSGGTTTTGGTTSGGGGLAETGAEDEGALHALALAAGTVILLGGAVFAFTPWTRLRR